MPPCCGGAPGSETLLATVCIEELSTALVADNNAEEVAFEPRSCLQPLGGRQSYRAGHTNFDDDVERGEFTIDFSRTDVDLNPQCGNDTLPRVQASKDQTWKEDPELRTRFSAQLERHPTNCAHKGAAIARSLQSAKDLAEYLGYEVKYNWPTIGPLTFGPYQHRPEFGDETDVWMMVVRGQSAITKPQAQLNGIGID